MHLCHIDASCDRPTARHSLRNSKERATTGRMELLQHSLRLHCRVSMLDLSSLLFLWTSNESIRHVAAVAVALPWSTSFGLVLSCQERALPGTLFRVSLSDRPISASVASEKDVTGASP